ncbi:MAG: hypothetical protein JO286_24975 [Solirubrobacterales bacterium]|nr:hypothetical protein [Solirubrobacterales bacterium]MBV9680171.1 hypothetical protein [Solirubrobacterales bacterium]MBV9810455.1 hypothetical protein [Solirubrobacterales bacterium]
MLARDAALARVSRTRRWVIAAAAALTAGFAALVSAVAPGKTLTSKSPGLASAATATRSTPGSTRSSAIPAMPPPAKAGDLGLQAPGQAPSSVPDQSQPQSIPSQPPPAPPSSSSGGGGGVVSGGS